MEGTVKAFPVSALSLRNIKSEGLVLSSKTDIGASPVPRFFSTLIFTLHIHILYRKWNIQATKCENDSLQ